MLGQDTIEQLTQQIKNIMQHNPLPDIEKNIKAVLSSMFSKLDLVTREEFATQEKVLLQTRKKLEELEEQLKQLEKLTK